MPVLNCLFIIKPWYLLKGVLLVLSFSMLVRFHLLACRCWKSLILPDVTDAFQTRGTTEDDFIHPHPSFNNQELRQNKDRPLPPFSVSFSLGLFSFPVLPHPLYLSSHFFPLPPPPPPYLSPSLHTLVSYFEA